ncbi:WhiB family transcriptional regulator [Embleya sp. NPDC001921]
MSRLPAVYYDTSATSTEPGYRWWEHAACKGQSELFFPERNADISRAKKICAACPVREICLAEELERFSPAHRWGVRGGMAETARRDLG